MVIATSEGIPTFGFALFLLHLSSFFIQTIVLSSFFTFHLLGVKSLLTCSYCTIQWIEPFTLVSQAQVCFDQKTMYCISDIIALSLYNLPFISETQYFTVRNVSPFPFPIFNQIYSYFWHTMNSNDQHTLAAYVLTGPTSVLKVSY